MGQPIADAFLAHPLGPLVKALTVAPLVPVAATRCSTVAGMFLAGTFKVARPNELAFSDFCPPKNR